MQVSNQTDNLINNLKDLKLKLSSDEATNVEKFTYILSDALNSVNNKNISAEGATQLSSEENYTGIPSWVDQAYPYDSKNPRKPNLRELVEVLSGRTVEDLYADPKSEWQTLFAKASTILDGVIGSNTDTRDWTSIMKSEDIISAANAETGKMYEPLIDLETSNKNTSETQQFAIIKDKNDNILTTVPSDPAKAEETLRSFGATYASVPANLESKVIPGKFNEPLLNFLKNFDKNPDQTDKIVLQATADALSKKLSEEIPLEELNKL